MLKIIRCMTIVAIGPKVRYIRIGRIMLTFRNRSLLIIVENETLPLMKIGHPDHDFALCVGLRLPWAPIPGTTKHKIFDHL
jgi:hypothetical protein